MIEIEAVSIAAPVFRLAQSGPVAGITHSVFAHTVNLLSGEQLITLADFRGGNLPYGICCRFEDLNLDNLFQCGASFTLHSSAVSFSPSSLAVDLGSAKTWQPARPGINTRTVGGWAARLAFFLLSLTSAPASLPHLSWLANRLDNAAAVPHSGENWVLRFAARVEQLIHAVMNNHWPTVEEAAGELLGLGIGLTPSGDDFLAGFITIGLALGPRESFERLAWAIAKRAPTSTTLVSAAFLRALSQGQLSERFGALLAAPDDDSNTLEEAARNMLAFGSSSGLETMYGLLYGLRAVEGIESIKTA